MEVNLAVACRHSSLNTRTSVSKTPTQTPGGVECVCTHNVESNAHAQTHVGENVWVFAHSGEIGSIYCVFY